MSNALTNLFHAHTRVESARHLREYASARLEREQANERRWKLVSQYEPVAKLGVDRHTIDALLSYVLDHGDERRMLNQIAANPDPTRTIEFTQEQIQNLIGVVDKVQGEHGPGYEEHAARKLRFANDSFAATSPEGGSEQ